GSSRAIGVLVASGEGPARFDEDAVRLLEAIGGQCGQALERAALYRDAQEAAARSTRLQTATLSMAEATTLEDVADHAVDFAMDLVDATIGALTVFDQDARRLRTMHHVGGSRALVDRWTEVALDGVPDADRGPVWHTVDDLRRTDPLVADELEPFGVRSLALLPLTSGGDVLGFIGLARQGDEPPPRDQREALGSFCDRVAAAVHRANLLSAERRTRRELERTLSR